MILVIKNQNNSYHSSAKLVSTMRVMEITYVKQAQLFCLCLQEHPCWEASYRGLKTTSLLYAEWWGLDENERKYNLGLLLIQIFIIQVILFAHPKSFVHTAYTNGRFP